MGEPFPLPPDTRIRLKDAPTISILSHGRRPEALIVQLILGDLYAIRIFGSRDHYMARREAFDVLGLPDERSPMEAIEDLALRVRRLEGQAAESYDWSKDVHHEGGSPC